MHFSLGSTSIGKAEAARMTVRSRTPSETDLRTFKTATPLGRRGSENLHTAVSPNVFEEFEIVGEGLEFWERYKTVAQQEELPLFDMSSISGVKPTHEPIDQASAFGKLPDDEGMSTRFSDLTARDLYALMHRRPISSIPGINEFINKENNI